MVDPARLRALLDRLADETRNLERLAAKGSAPLREPDLLAAIKYRLIVAIETCIDAGQRIVASEKLRAPTDFADVFAILGDSGYVPPALVPALQDMARFRNLLVHGYLRVDDERVLEILRTHLGDLDAFRREIAGSALDGPEQA